MKHTPGPWHIGQWNGEDHIFSDKGRMRLEANGTTLYAICTMNTGWNKEEDQANAALIAVAPKLLAALENLLDMVTDMRTHGPAVEAAADVIYKVRGE